VTREIHLEDWDQKQASHRKVARAGNRLGVHGATMIGGATTIMVMIGVVTTTMNMMMTGGVAMTIITMTTKTETIIGAEMTTSKLTITGVENPTNMTIGIIIRNQENLPRPESPRRPASRPNLRRVRNRKCLRNRNLQSQANRPICQRVFLPTCLPSRRTQRHLWPPQDN